jgi:hypothetical protein
VDAPEKTPVEQAVEHAVEVFVYAPIGLLFEGASLLPQLVEKGKSQVTMARLIGQFAVQQGKGEATKAVSKLQDQAAGVLDFLGDSVGPLPDDPAPVVPVARAARTAGEAATKAASRAVATAGSTAAATAAGARRATNGTATRAATTVVEADDLAIPDYDSLSASHVVNRLAGLTDTELEAVRLYEAANRGRKTILSKVQQLQSR